MGEQEARTPAAGKNGGKRELLTRERMLERLSLEKKMTWGLLAFALAVLLVLAVALGLIMRAVDGPSMTPGYIVIGAIAFCIALGLTISNLKSGKDAKRIAAGDFFISMETLRKKTVANGRTEAETAYMLWFVLSDTGEEKRFRTTKELLDRAQVGESYYLIRCGGRVVDWLPASRWELDGELQGYLRSPKA